MSPLLAFLYTLVIMGCLLLILSIKNPLQMQNEIVDEKQAILSITLFFVLFIAVFGMLMRK